MRFYIMHANPKSLSAVFNHASPSGESSAGHGQDGLNPNYHTSTQPALPHCKLATVPLWIRPGEITAHRRCHKSEKNCFCSSACLIRFEGRLPLVPRLITDRSVTCQWIFMPMHSGDWRMRHRPLFGPLRNYSGPFGCAAGGARTEATLPI